MWNGPRKKSILEDLVIGGHYNPNTYPNFAILVIINRLSIPFSVGDTSLDHQRWNEATIKGASRTNCVQKIHLEYIKRFIKKGRLLVIINSIDTPIIPTAIKYSIINSYQLWCYNIFLLYSVCMIYTTVWPWWYMCNIYIQPRRYFHVLIIR